jgi:hypothetical protein
MRVDFTTRCAWIVIAVSLAWIALQPLTAPSTVKAQAGDVHPFYVEPGVTLLRSPDGSRQVYGKVMIDMRTGKVWGFPTIQSDSVYPYDPMSSTAQTSRPFLLGRFALGDTDK